MQRIILTKQHTEGAWLQYGIKTVAPDYETISCYTKEDVINHPAQFKEVEYIFSTWYMPEFTETEITKFFPSLKALFYAAGTVKYFAESFLKNGVRVFSSAKANGVAVAEFVVAQILLANKGYFQAQITNKSILWRWAFKHAKRYADNRTGNYNSKVGLIGCGSVGSEVVKLLSPYNLEIIIHDPYISAERCKQLGVKNVDLETLFETCDVISNHLPDIPSTKGIINYDLLRRMKDYSTFINTGRGAQVAEADLAKLLRKRPSICALLDVVQREVLWPCSPLLRRKNCFISPHIAGSVGNELLRMVKYSVMAYEDMINGRINEMEVSLSMLDKMA